MRNNFSTHFRKDKMKNLAKAERLPTLKRSVWKPLLALLLFAPLQPCLPSDPKEMPDKSPGQTAPTAERHLGHPPLITIEVQFISMSRAVAKELLQQEAGALRIGVKVKEDSLQRIRELQKTKQIKILSAPKITTISGEPAWVLMVQEFSSISACKVDEKGVATPVISTEEGGTTLDCTPMASPDGKNITINKLALSLTELSELPRGSERRPDYFLNQPAVSRRDLTTNLTLTSGSTILISGMESLASEKKDQDQVMFTLLTARVFHY